MVKKANAQKSGFSGWAKTLHEPFTSPPVSIPDDRTTQSGKVTSRLTGFLTLPSNSGTWVTHNGGATIFPDPYASMAVWVEGTPGNGVFTDLNFDGSGAAQLLSCPNVSSFIPNTGRVRCTGIGVRIVYEGTELTRSGKIYAGMGAITAQAKSGVAALTPYALSPSSTIFGNASWSAATVKQRLEMTATQRIRDGVFEAHWVPSGVPNYQDCQGIANGVTFAAGPNTSAAVSYYNAPSGGFGIESGQNALVIMIEGDTTVASGANGNTYSYDVIWHWEVIPSSPYSVPYPLTPSQSDPMRLARDLNSLHTAVARQVVVTSGTVSTGPPVGAAPGRRQSMARMVYNNLPSAETVGRVARVMSNIMATAPRVAPRRVAPARAQRRIEL